MRIEDSSVEHWEILLLGQSYSSCKDLDIFFFQESEQKLASLTGKHD